MPTLRRFLLPVCALASALVFSPACGPRQQGTPPAAGPAPVDAAPDIAPLPPVVPWDPSGPLAAGETYVPDPDGARRETVAKARTQGLLDVDLSDNWAPFILSESDESGGPVKPNPYRATFMSLAADRASPDEILMETPQGELAAVSAAGISLARGATETPEGQRAIAEAKRAVRVQRDRNYLEAYGIPPALSVLLLRMEEDRGKTCFAQVDLAGLAAFNGNVTFQSREQAKTEYGEALADAAWVGKLLATEQSGADATTGKIQQGLPNPASGSDDSETLLATLARNDRQLGKRIDRYRRGQARLRAVRALQARLLCEGLLVPRARYTQGIFDLATNEALAAWERKNNIFGWGFLGGETLAALQRPVMDLHFDTFRRIVMERIADSAAILEDGSVANGPRPATYRDAAGNEQRVPNLIGEFADALLARLGVKNSGDVLTFLRRVGPEGLATLHVAFAPPPLPPYYGKEMRLSVEIDRGDVWYDFPFDEEGRPIVQERRAFPSLTVLVDWGRQKIPLVRWRTTIGSWRSETGGDDKVYYKYKNSDVGPRVWKDIVAAPVWIPPDGTPPRDLLTRKTLDRDVGAATVVNSDVMGPGFQSAYGLVLAIHQRPGGGDNQIRTHGSVDYTSIARRYSHGCHRLVNSRAVRLFDFLLRRRPFERLGNQVINVRKRFSYEDKEYEYLLGTRGYYYRLKQPIPVVVTRGNIKGKVKVPIEAYMQKPGVDYRDEQEGGP